MTQAFVSVKNLAAYCLDYAKLISPALAQSSAQSEILQSDTLDCSPFLVAPQSDAPLRLPFNLNLATSSINKAEQNDDIDDAETDSADNDGVVNLAADQLSPEAAVDPAVQRDIRIARQLEDLNRKFETSSYTKQLQLEFGFVTFNAKDISKDTSESEKVSRPLFTVPVQLIKVDSGGKRQYSLEITDDIITCNIAFLSKYLPVTYYDELFNFVSIVEHERKNALPISAELIDALWSKIKTYLLLVEATDISERLEVTQSVVALNSKSNYFLSQDLMQLSELDEADLQDTALSAWTSDEDMSIKIDTDDIGGNELFFPFPYDKWQLQVLGILDNKAAIVEGPPGTGKSQTISNIACHLAAQGKKVLFVSQKDQAIRGVKDKLKTLDIPFLFGYIPDRNSILHTTEDEKDSAAHTLVTLSHDVHAADLQDPRAILSQSAILKPAFSSSIDVERDLYKLYEQLASLEHYNFEPSHLSLEWWMEYDHDFLSAAKIQTLLAGFVSKHDTYVKEHDESYKLLEVDDHKVATSIRTSLDIFEKYALDRGGIKRKIKDVQLKQLLKQTLADVPSEIYNEVLSSAFAETSKAQRNASLRALHDYFAYRDAKTKLQRHLSSMSALLKSAQISGENLNRLRKIIASESPEIVFSKIAERTELRGRIDATEKHNANNLRDQIAHAQHEYTSSTVGYIRNRLKLNVDTLRTQMKKRGRLERIARALAKSKRAYKTFDRLKSDPENFAVMAEVVPIWMMSLDDASRILPMQKNLFDYVIIDEASQCNIAYALPVMYRAQHTIFFGDTLQMRDSTTLFKTNEQLNAIATKHGISDAYQIKAAEDSIKSVMDIGKLAGFQPANLKYHYRSPKELIGFSNEYIYKKHGRELEVINDSCLTYKDTGRVMVNHVVQARPDMDISAKTNIAEAYYIKQLIAELRTDTSTHEKSIAVLTFFNEQAELIRKVVEDPSIKVSIIDGIQGDERDIIIYSFVISSPDQKNRYVALTSEGGEVRRDANEGRINVAFSRAKLQVHAVTSLQPQLWPEGIWIKKYLEYIEKHGTVSSRHAIDDQHFDSQFEKNVYTFLSQKLSPKEFSLATQVKSCGFKIDLVVSNLKSGKTLAIECDGPTHFEHGDGQVYVHNDFERQSILEIASWNFYRIPYHTWFEQTHDAQDELLAYIADYFAVIPQAKKDKAAEQDVTSYAALPIREVEIPAELVASLKQAQTSSKSKQRFGK